MPFCVAILGDFSGRSTASTAGPSWRPLAATPDTVPDLVGLEPRIELSLGRGGRESLQLTFQTLDDFHPDSLFTRLPIFEQLRDARLAVQDGRPTPWGEDGGASAGGAEDRTSAGRRVDAGEGESGAGDDAPAGVADVLDRILEESAARPDSRSTTGPDRELREFVHRIVEPYRVRPKPDRSAELAAIDEASGALMRHVTGHVAFRSLEALWRSIVLLLSWIDTSSKVRVYLIDVSRAELERTMASGDDPTRSRLYDLLSTPDLGPVATRWAVAVGAYTFCDTPADANLADHIARVAAAAEVPWFSEAAPELAGWAAPHESADPREWSDPWVGDWARLPSAPHAAYMGLALPRFLAREPYGEDAGRRCVTFDYRELAPLPDGADEGVDDAGPGSPAAHLEALLWANPAVLCAAALARAFVRDEWDLSLNTALEFGQMPIAPGLRAGAPPLLTEIRLSRTAAERLAELGLIPLVTFPFEARIRLGGIRPLASRPVRLGAWWNR